MKRSEFAPQGQIGALGSLRAIAAATKIGAQGSESNQREDHPHEQPQEAAAPGKRENKP